MSDNKEQSGSEWKTTGIANMVRRNGAVYYAQVKIDGKTYRRSLRTQKRRIAQVKLPAVLNEIRARVEDLLSFDYNGGRETLRGCANEWLRLQLIRPDLKDSTKRFSERRVNDLLDTLPVDDAVRSVSVSVFREWWRVQGKRFNPNYANQLLSCARAVVQIQVDAGIRASNPLLDFFRMKAAKKLMVLPSGNEMTALIDDIRKQYGRFAEESADMVAFMAYTGMRPEEVAQLKSSDLLDDVIAVRMGEKGTKTYSERTVPIMAELEEVLDKRRGIVGKLWSIKSPRIAMTRSCKRLGIKRVTRYDCRHFFATRCLESGVDVPTVAKWLGHKDGGITLMKTYSHVTDKHGLEAAKKVKLG